MRNLLLKTCLGTLVLVSFLIASSPAYGKSNTFSNTKIPRGFIIDQRNDETTGSRFGLSNNIKYYQPMGQEFVPTKNKLVGVDVFMGGYKKGDTDLILNIRKDNIHNPILASRQVYVASHYRGWVHVSFLPPVKLQPGSRYVIQVALSDPDGGLSIVSDGRCKVDTYLFGGWILWGKPRDRINCYNDLVFRTYTLKSSY